MGNINFSKSVWRVFSADLVLTHTRVCKRYPSKIVVLNLFSNKEALAMFRLEMYHFMHLYLLEFTLL